MVCSLSNGCGTYVIPPCSLIAAIVSANVIPPGIVRSRNRPMISPSLLLTSSPTMTRTP